ncbi:MAG: DUF4406 domain-containing protein [Phycisphaeraceae bacterium]|nr:DUF4406 domain-containing protein [Phycisphaeraceae bacterium]
MKVVFITGPYRDKSEWQVELNIRAAEALALEVWKLGAAAHCPHKNTSRFGGAQPDKVWLDGDLEIMRRCDAVVCTADWRRSEGATAEVATARGLGIPVFESVEGLAQWLKCPA